MSQHFKHLWVSCVDTPRTALSEAIGYMCRHFKHSFFNCYILSPCVDTSRSMCQLLVISSKLWPLFTCVDTSVSCVDSWSFMFKSLASVSMCRHFNVMCRHLHFQIIYCLHVLTLQPDVSTLHFQTQVYCLHMSTLRPDVSTLHFQTQVYCLHVSTLLTQKVQLCKITSILLHRFVDLMNNYSKAYTK